MSRTPSEVPRYDELVGRSGAPDHSSWGVWGSEDRLGSLNRLTPEVIARGAGQIREGLVISLNASLTAFAPPLFGRAPMLHEVCEFNEGRIRDETLSNLNTQATSQWDGFRHVRSGQHGFYNGLRESDVSISDWADAGIAGRGVLVDAERWYAEQGRPLDFEAAVAISVEDLRAMVHALTEPFEPGDIVVLHTGWLGHRLGGPHVAGSFRAPGLEPSREMLAYLWDLGCAAIVSDNPSLEVWPPGACVTPEVKAEARAAENDDPRVFMHYELIALLGMAVGELWDTRRLVAAARRLDRSAFFLTSAPLPIENGVASTANALAIF